MVHLARAYGEGPVSAAAIAEAQQYSYQLACKLLQRLVKAGLVRSCMGINGGYALARAPERIGLMEVIEVIQGPLSLSPCLLGDAACPNRKVCPIRGKLGELQGQMAGFLGGTSLTDLLKAKSG